MIKLNPPYIDVEETMPLVEQVLRSGILTQGPMVEEFEYLCAKMAQTKFAIATTSATTALELVLAAIGRYGGTNEVITTPFTFTATINAILRAGLIPRYADIGDDYLIDPESVNRLVNDKTMAIMPVHIYGCPSDVNEYYKIDGPLVHVIEDASQAHGASIDGFRVGGLGSAGVFSFYGTKNVAAGEGGVVTTNNDILVRELLKLRNHAIGGYPRAIPTNARMSELQAAVAIPQLKNLDEINAKRRSNAMVLMSYLGMHPHASKEGITSNFHLYTIEVDRPQHFIEWMAEKGVECRSYYRYIFDPYMMVGTNMLDKFPRAYEKAKRVVSIPVHPGLTEDEIHTVGRLTSEYLQIQESGN